MRYSIEMASEGTEKKKGCQSFPVIMAIFLLFFAIPGCFSCNAHMTPKNRAKVVEDYVVSAKFDENKNLPQLQERIQAEEILRENASKYSGRPEAKDSFSLLPSGRENHKNHGHTIYDFEDRDTLEERDLLVHHHHIPPLPHPPPPPPPPLPPAGLAYAPSLFAVGLITFLILLNSLQTSLLLMIKSKGSVLGSVTGALGRRRRRRKRFVSEELGKFRENFRKSETIF